MDKTAKLFWAWAVINAAFIVFGVAGYIAIHFEVWISGMDASDWFGFSALLGMMSYLAEILGIWIAYPIPY